LKKVVVLGSANTDLTIQAERLPRPHETVGNGEFRMSYGGKGANQALAALKAGADVSLLAKIGTDAFGNLLFNHLLRSGLPDEGLLRDPQTSAGVALITIDDKGNNQIVVAPGSNMRFSVEEFRARRRLLSGAAVLLTQLEIPLPTVEYALRLAKSRGVMTILDPAPFRSLSSSIYHSTEVLTPNKTEAGDLAGMEVNTINQAKEAATIIHSRGCGAVLVTLGEQGALLKQGNRIEHFPAFPVRSKDSVAAGDAFNGALAAAMVRGKPIQEAIRFANAAGALCTTKRGAQESLPSKPEIEALLRPT
jgi:ribokinase